MAVFIVVLSMFSFSVLVKAENEKIYIDSLTGVGFAVPEGWKETPLMEERETIKVKYIHESDDGATILFGSFDLWGQLSDNEKSGFSRSDMNHLTMFGGLSNEELLEIIGYDKLDAKIDTVRYNGNEYFKIEFDMGISVLDYSTNIKNTVLMHGDNGYGYTFWYGDLEEKSHYQEFEEMIESVKYRKSVKSTNQVITIDENGDLHFDFVYLILCFIITVAVYSLPIFIYRYVIRKRTLPEDKAKKATIIYAVISFIVMIVFIGGTPGAAIILWSYVNYSVLTTPTKKELDSRFVNSTEEMNGETEKADDENIASFENKTKPEEIFDNELKTNQIDEYIFEQETIISSENTEKIKCEVKPLAFEKTPPKVLFCRKCGAKLLEDSDFCHKCGFRIIREDIK